MRALVADAALAIGGSFAASLLLKVTVTLRLALIATGSPDGAAPLCVTWCWRQHLRSCWRCRRPRS